MELRLLSTTDERREFAHNLVATRISKGAGFSETRRSMVGEAHLAFGRLYALYDEKGAEPNQMIAGFVLHDLGTFPQSYPKPDLTSFPPEAVIECGELWASAAGSARIVRQAAWILAGQLKSEAVLLYPIFKPWNLSRSYNHDFDRVGEPIEWPYARTLDGGRIYVQAMVSQGERLARMVSEAGQWGFRANEDQTCINFNTPFGISSRMRLRQDRGGETRGEVLRTSDAA
ncbi:MAG: hypothetical protein ACLQBA_26500 [Candidatus Binataceae bacterium]